MDSRQQHSRIHRLLAGLLCALLFTACASIDNSKKNITLNNALWHYENAIRWADFTTANAMRRLDGKPDTSSDILHLKNIRVTDYETLGTTHSPDGSEAIIEVAISWYNENSMKVTTVVDRQVWKYDPEIKAWYISTPLPAFR